jgi:hypothetical protein
MRSYAITISCLLPFLLLNTFSDKVTVKTECRESISSQEMETISDSILSFDSTIFLLKQPVSHYHGINLTDSLAKIVLYNHFKSQGYLIQEELKGDYSEENEKRSCVRFSKIHEVDLNNNSFIDAVVEYWLSPIYASGHCWQPHKAIIMDTDDGYQISNEEFIPINFDIDSVSIFQGHPTLFGYDYNCGEDRILRYFTLTLKCKE